MKRNVRMEDISDGKLYTANDLVKADCGDCEGCSACCRGMGSSIVLDPLDIYRLTTGLGVRFEQLLSDKIELNVVDGIILPNLCRGMGSSIVLDPLDIYRLTTGLGVRFEQLLSDKIELNVVDGIILPNLKMGGEKECCEFLNEEGRCSIHGIRPGICRLFPLGRFYEDGGFKYFLQIHECKKENRTKVKVKKWIDTPDLKKYESFISEWHYFLLELQGKLLKIEEEKVK